MLRYLVFSLRFAIALEETHPKVMAYRQMAHPGLLRAQQLTKFNRPSGALGAGRPNKSPIRDGCSKAQVYPMGFAHLPDPSRQSAEAKSAERRTTVTTRPPTHQTTPLPPKNPTQLGKSGSSGAPHPPDLASWGPLDNCMPQQRLPVLVSGATRPPHFAPLGTVPIALAI